MKSILDPTFRYTPAVATDIRQTFAKARREMRRRSILVERPSVKHLERRKAQEAA